MPDATLEEARSRLDHVVGLALENRSFDPCSASLSYPACRRPSASDTPTPSISPTPPKARQ